MPTSAELRRMRRIERWIGIIVPRVARRAVNGKAPQPGWLPRRRIEVPGHGRLLVAWKSRSTGSGGLRPLIVAVGRDGSELSRIGPHDSIDSYTWAKLSGHQELKLRTAGKHRRWPSPQGSNAPWRVQ